MGDFEAAVYAISDDVSYYRFRWGDRCEVT